MAFRSIRSLEKNMQTLVVTKEGRKYEGDLLEFGLGYVILGSSKYESVEDVKIYTYDIVNIYQYTQRGKLIRTI